MKKYFLIVLLNISYFIGFSQDSTWLPKPTHTGKYIAHTYYSLKVVPKALLQAIDKFNGSHVKFYERNERVKDRKEVPSNSKREFRALAEERDHLLMTYAHWQGKKHIHFIVWTSDGYVTTGMSDYEIDSLNTIERLKTTNEVTFINLSAKRNVHKF